MQRARRTPIDRAFAFHADGGRVCKDCGERLPQQRNGSHKIRSALRCPDCWSARNLYVQVASGRMMAALAVAQARKRGELAAPSAHRCTDCDRPASCYDHRDYNEPLRVDPVCHRCNINRGHALPFNPYLVGLLLAEVVRQATQSRIGYVNPSTNISCARHGTDALSFAPF